MGGETKFTPGPWSRRDTETHAEIDAPGHATLAMVATADDADLIAAAPDLYQLVELFEREAEYQVRRAENHGDDEGARLRSMTLAMIRAALSKARGHD